MNFVSYAQNFEDVILWRALRDIGEGSYLDIGAQDPVVDSVSLAFYERGWRGTHVEPTPYYAQRLREARPDEAVIQAAVTDEDGPIEIFEIAGTGLSTGVTEIASNHERAGFEGRTIAVPAVRLDQLFKLGDKPPHWMKVDVEGMEAEVLRSWNESDARPWLLVIESTYPNSQKPTHQDWLSQVLDRGYEEVFFDGLSRYFLHETQRERRRAFEAPPNIFDGFWVARHHFSASAIRQQLESSEARARDDEARAAELRFRAEEYERRLTTEQALAAALQGQLQQMQSAVLDAGQREVAAIRHLAEAEREHRISLERLVAEHNAASYDLRRQISELTSKDAASQVELVRKEEQTAFLEHQFSGEQDYRRRAEAAVAQAGALIAALRAESPTLWLRIGRSMRLWKEPNSFRALLQWSPDSIMPPTQTELTPDSEGADHLMAMSAASQPRNPYHRANSLAELLSWNDVNFVRCAYVTVLGRQPDPKGEVHYVQRLRAGRAKSEILWELRKSREGQRHDPGISGFDRILKRSAWERHWAFGPFVRLYTKGDADDRLQRHFRSLSNELGLIKDMIGYADPTVRWSAPNPEPVAWSMTAPELLDEEVDDDSGKRLSPAAASSFAILSGQNSR